MNKITLLQSKGFQRASRFAVVGGIAAAVNLVAVWSLISFFFAEQVIYRNLANILALFFGVTTAFFLNRKWTWQDSPQFCGFALFRQYLIYCISASIGGMVRIVLFAWLDYLDVVHYLINVTIGIGVAAIIDFLLYNRFVFPLQKHLGVNK